tara:strand:+ start:6892 stop:8328 length:1437 start_codon:yes stop_codon:yes gene_type:complete
LGPTLDVVNLTARQQAALIQNREISCVELLEAHLSIIDQVNPILNAIVTQVPEMARATASELDRRLAADENPGPLTGLPIAHKDLAATKGIRTTFSSRLHSDNIPDKNALFIDRLQAAGAVTIGKTNAPEFGAGSQTFNEVFGATCNPYAHDRTCGGSSGGAATALAARMIPIADGGDFGGSLRNPAAFCNVVGFRPSIGRVPQEDSQGFFPMRVLGPMARTVDDTALLLSAMAGPHVRDVQSLPEDGLMFDQPLDLATCGLKIGFTSDFGGQAAVDADVQQVIDGNRRVLTDLGCNVETFHPDFSGADEVFQTLRAWNFAGVFSQGIEKHPDMYKDTIIWNTQQGQHLTGVDIHDTEVLRTQVVRRFRAYFESYDFLVMPVTQVPPFDITTDWVKEINGVTQNTYLDWMRSCYWISVTGLPAISVPGGFTPEGLPIGLQIVGAPQRDLSVLKMAHAFEQATRHYRIRPQILADILSP